MNAPLPAAQQGEAPLVQASRIASQIAENAATVLVGKRHAVDLAVTAFLAGGHLLLEDVPGVGKTTLARALAKSVGVDFRRLQFTSDLMPADVLGGSVYNQAQGTFDFRRGPVFTNVLLADEINRTTPKTQSALLEAMGERSVSIDGVTHDLDDPFFVVATQNPAEFHGTYPLPESQLDRFLVRMRLGYPPPEAERRVLMARRGSDPLAKLAVVVSREQARAARAAVDEVKIDPVVVDYLLAIVHATRNASTIQIGASTRAAIAYERGCRAHALVKGRDYVTPDDVRDLAVPVLAHRIHLAGASQPAQATEEAEHVVRDLVRLVEIPI